MGGPDAAHLDVAHPQSGTPRPCEIRNQRHYARDPPIDIPPHTRIPPRTLASCIPRQLVNPPRDLRDLPPSPLPGDAPAPPRSSSTRPGRKTHPSPHDAEHVLLLTCLLLLTAPVLAVWARTLATAGIDAAVSTAGCDHNVLSVAPYLVLVYFASWTRDALRPTDRCAAALSFSSCSALLIDVG